MTKQLWTAIIAFVMANVLYFGAKYFPPEIAADIQFVIDAAKLLVAVLLLHFYGEDAKLAIRVAIQNLNK